MSLVLVPGRVNNPVPGDDEFACLNLNITTPTEVQSEDRNEGARSSLSVMVWIHGCIFIFRNYSQSFSARFKMSASSDPAQRRI